MKNPNTTAKEMVASGNWAKDGKGAYRHVSGTVVRKDGAHWEVNGKRFVVLWLARVDVEGLK